MHDICYDISRLRSTTYVASPNPDDSHFPHSVKMNLGRTQLDTTFFLFLSFLE